MADSLPMARLRGGHYNTADWNAATNQGGMGGDGHRYALVPPKAPQVPTYAVLVNDLVTVTDELAANATAAIASAAGAAGSALSATQDLTRARQLLAGATLDGTSTSSSSLAVTTGAKSATVAVNKGFVAGHEVQATRVSDPNTWLRGSVTSYNAGTGALAFTASLVNAPSGTGPFTDWVISVMSRQDAAGGAAAVTLAGAHTLTNLSARVQGLNPDGTSRDVTLPNATTILNAGGPVFIIANTQPDVSNGAALILKNAAGTVLRHLYPGDIAHVSLLDRSTANGTWAINVTAGDPYDRNAVVSLSTDFNLSNRTGRNLSFTPTLPGRAVYLPDATTMPYTGGPIFNITNTSASLSFQIRGGTGVLLDEVQPGQTVLVWLRDKSSAAGAWNLMVADRPSGTAFSTRQVLDTNFCHNHQISPTSQANKALWSYSRSGNLSVRVLTISGQTVTPGAEQVLAPGPNGGMALALTDTYGVACWATSTDTFHQGFTINLTTGACALTGSPVAWGVSTAPDIRMSRLPGSSTHCVAVARSGDMYARLIGFTGSTLTQSSTLTWSGSSRAAGCHDVVALSGTEAGLMLADSTVSNRLTRRKLDLNTSAMTIGNGGASTVSGAAVATVISTRLTVNAEAYYLTMTPTENYSEGAVLWFNLDGGATTGRHKLTHDGTGGRPGACIAWPGIMLVTLFYSAYDRSTNYTRAFIQDFNWDIGRYSANPWEPNVLRPSSPPRLMTAVTGGAIGNEDYYHAAAAAALNSTTGLFIYSDANNSNYPTAVFVERIT